jgi:excinuclease ABC subunit A
LDIGPEAGNLGGNLVAQGSYDEILKSTSLTAKIRTGFRNFGSEKRRSSKNYIEIKGARENNLQKILMLNSFHLMF